MKVVLLGFGKIAYMPYMNFYIETLSFKTDVVFDLIYWERDGKPDTDIPSRVRKAYKFVAHIEEQLPFKSKLKYFIKYRAFALELLKKNKYDRIIVLHTTPGLTILDYLICHFRGRYILDFRDITYEYIFFYQKLVSKLAEGSIITYISSSAFRKFLPNLNNIYIIHNYLEDSLNHRLLRKSNSRDCRVLKVCYWGLVRQVDVNKIIIDALGNDKRFELHYYGRMQQDGREMEQYTIKRKYSNVFFHGQYMPTERYNFANTADLIHNIYNLKHTSLNAMGNKYYDGIIFGIPQICTKGSHMGNIITSQQVGIAVDLDVKNMADYIWEYYNNIDWKQFEINCEIALNNVLREQAIAKEKLLEVF